MTPAVPDVRRSTVSVVIPVKDDADALRRCLRALALQDGRIDEIVVVDNGSADASAQVARDAGASVVTCDHPGNPAAAAYGYDRARGQIILRLDADCIPGARWAATMTDAFDRRPDVAVFTGDARFIDGPRLLRGPLAVGYLVGYAALCAPALGHLPIFGSNLGFRRTAWRSIRAAAHRSDPEIHDDLDLAYHFGERHRIRFLPGAAMGMSMRPFQSVAAFVRRIARGGRTVIVHWPHDFPPVRWVRLLLRRVLSRLGIPTRRATA